MQPEQEFLQRLSKWGNRIEQTPLAKLYTYGTGVLDLDCGEGSERVRYTVTGGNVCCTTEDLHTTDAKGDWVQLVSRFALLGMSSKNSRWRTITAVPDITYPPPSSHVPEMVDYFSGARGENRSYKDRRGQYMFYLCEGWPKTCLRYILVESTNTTRQMLGAE
jgi:hypothetical protein